MWTVVGVSVSLVFQLFSVFLSPGSRLLDPQCCMDGALVGSRHESIKKSTEVAKHIRHERVRGRTVEHAVDVPVLRILETRVLS